MKLKYLYLFSFIIVFISGCSELKTDISEPHTITFHKPGILNPDSHEWHGTLIKNNNWDMRECRQCHSAQYSGGTTNATCLNCHTNTNGPEACNTCHGSFNNPGRIAPPEDLNENTSTTLLSVGAHTQHLYDNTLGNTIRCSTCHNFPSGVYAEGHIDNTPGAEVILKQLSIFNLGASSVYNKTEGTCGNTYCHGNFEFKKSDAAPENQFAYIADKMTGNNKLVKWNKVDASEAVCGSCHGLPPEGHIQVPLNSCVSCHSTVVDESGNIIDKTKHIDGNVNVRLSK